MDIVTYALCKKLVGNVKGDKGDKGDIGLTPNVQIGTVTTLPSTQNATVTRTGTDENPIFSFGIPRGSKGIFVGSKDDAPLDADIVIDHSDDGIYFNDLVNTPIVGNTLTLTVHKNQITTMQDNTTIVLPTVNRFTEIHLFFSTTSELTLTLPNIKWSNLPTLEANKTFEFKFIYTTEWLGDCVVYS